MAEDVWQAGFELRLRELVSADAEVRDRLPDPAVAERVRQPGIGLAQVVNEVMTGYADRVALGERHEKLGEDSSTRTSSPYQTLTFRQLWSHARAAASAWHHSLSVGPDSGDMLCSIGAGSINYATLELACIAAGVVSVPLITNSSPAQWQSIIGETQPAALAVDLDYLDAATDAILASNARPRVVYVLDYRRDELEAREIFQRVAARLEADGVRTEAFQDLLARGKELPLCPLPQTPAGPQPLAQIIYTSGATGTPKGAMFTRAHLASMWIGQAQAKMPTIVTHYMPMSHVAGRMVLTGALARGGTCYFSTGNDPARMWDDIKTTQPTEFFLIPRVCEMIFDRYQRIVASIVQQDADQFGVEETAKTQLRNELLGGRVVSAVNGSAPLELKLHAFMESMLEVPVHDAYGSTEAGGVVMFNNHIQRPPVIDYKLADAPELGYHSTDRPFPRGELLLKTVSMVPGYFNRPDLNEEIFDTDGYYRTGDVMAQTGTDQLKFVERRNNVLKLSQAEFVAVANLEMIYTKCHTIHQIFIYGRSGRSSLLAVVVPTAAIMESHEEPALRELLSHSIQDQAKVEGLHPYEIPKSFLIEPEPFSVANGLLSGVSKLLRPKLHERYAETLERLHDELTAGQEDELEALRRGAAYRPVLETVQRAANALLGKDSSAVSPEASFADQGGDSMLSYQLATHLTDLFGIEIPAAVILAPGTGLRQIAEYVETERQGESTRITASQVHADPSRLHADELRLDAFLSVNLLEAARNLAPANGPGVYLLTGANGYLGRFLALQLLERASKDGSRVIGIVRGTDAETARARLDNAFGETDPELAERYRKLSDRLEVLPGDISQAQLGLSDQEWTRLATEITTIFHPAALVNHVLPYQELFGPNVAGTAELIKLSITTSRKRIVYLSTTGIADQIVPGEFCEGSDIRAMSPIRSIDNQYANGYTNTKWASEVLLREAHETHQVPVTVFRSNMILAHSQYAGQLNLPDIFTRLLFSVLVTGIAPESFYLPGAGGGRKRTHFDGVPVDFTAASVVTLAGDAGHRTYHLVNPNDDGISLDTFVDWLVESGHAIERLPYYRDWVDRLEISLRALPDPVRQRTLLPLLHAFAEPEKLPDSVPPAKDFEMEIAGSDESGGRIPSIEPSLIAKYVTDLRQVGLLS